MNISNSDLAGSVEYRTHVQEIGWQGYVKDNQLSGTSGKSFAARSDSNSLNWRNS